MYKRTKGASMKKKSKGGAMRKMSKGGTLKKMNEGGALNKAGKGQTRGTRSFSNLTTAKKKEFNKKIKLLKNKKVLKTIDSISEERSNQFKSKTLRFKQNNVHDFAWFADPNWIVNKGELWLEKSQKKVTLWSMYLPKNGKRTRLRKVF